MLLRKIFAGQASEREDGVGARKATEISDLHVKRDGEGEIDWREGFRVHAPFDPKDPSTFSKGWFRVGNLYLHRVGPSAHLSPEMFEVLAEKRVAYNPRALVTYYA